MRAKQVVSLVLVVLLLCTIAPATFASDAKVRTNDLYILSKECPADFEEFAKEKLETMLRNKNLSAPYIGIPFTFSNQDSDVYYFPIYSNGKIVLTLRVYQGRDGDPTGVLSTMLAEELNAIAPMTSATNPLKIVYETTNHQATISFRQNNYETIVHTNYDNSGEVPYVAMSASDGATIINCIPEARIAVAPATRTRHVLAVSTNYENQTSNNNWCLAYCTAAVMRYNDIEITAEEVMDEVHEGDYDATTSMGRLNLAPYMQSYGFHTVKSSDFPSIPDALMDIWWEINRSRPVILNMNGPNPNDYSVTIAHAVCAVGYDDSVDGPVIVWNPWYTTLEDVLDLSDYTPIRHQQYNFYLAEYWDGNWM